MAKYGRVIMNRALPGLVKDATDEALLALAFQIEGEAKVEIQQSGRIDTGFMMNSGFVKSHRRSTYAETDPSGVYDGTKTAGGHRERAPEPPIPANARVGVGFAAEYSIWQELADSFLVKSAKKVIRQAKGLLEKAYKTELPQ